MIYMGPLFEKTQEKEILERSHKGISNAANIFQWNLLEGIYENLGAGISIINSLPVGTWPKFYSSPVLKDRQWTWKDKNCYEIGCINLPVIKQMQRAVKTARILKKNFPNENEIIICTPYLPYLWAARSLRGKFKITVIVTDLPKFADIRHVSGFRKLLRTVHNLIINHYLKNVDRFVLITDAMRKPLDVGERPYVVVEGICSNHNELDVSKEEKKEGCVFLYAGGVNKRFGLDTLTEAFVQLDDPNCELWICGKGDMADKIKDLSESSSCIKYFGFVPHEKAIELQKKADVLVNPRTNEEEYTKYSFPSKTLEYLSNGKPVLMHKLDGIPDEYNDYLYFIEGNDVESLKKTIEWLSRIPREERNKRGLAGMRFVLDYKNPAAQAKKVLDMIFNDNAAASR